jgi:two-component sensor histidine kinase
MTTCAVDRGWDTQPEYPASAITTGVDRVVQRVRDSVDMDMLGTLGGIEQLHQATEPTSPWQLGAPITQPDGLGLMVEIAHDLRSPLTSILFLSETLHNGLSGDVNELQRRQLALIYSAALGLSRLVSNSIELASGVERLADSKPSPFSIKEMLEAVQDMVRPMAEEKDLVLHLRPQALDLRLGHPVALSRALLNLTCNALKFTEQGFVQIAAVAKRDSRVEFSVRDTGPGIESQALNRLYQPFRPSCTGAGLTFSGTGLGLAITRKLVAAMGSELQVESGSWGTRFYFEVDLPLASRSRAALNLQPGPAARGRFNARIQLRPRKHIPPSTRIHIHPSNGSTRRTANGRVRPSSPLPLPHVH